MWTKIQRRMQLAQLLSGLAGLLFGILLNVLSNSVGESSWWIKGGIIVFCIFSALTSVWLSSKQPDYIKLRMQPPDALRLPGEKLRAARKGIVVMMPLYTPQGANTARNVPPTQWSQWAAELDYPMLDFLQSNVATIIEAVMTHSSKLDHCWIIGTVGTDRNAPGSNTYIPALINYLRQEHGLICQFYHGEKYEISLIDDALVFNNTCKLIHSIFEEAKSLHLTPSDTIVDCTSGIRSIALGGVLSSLDAERDIQLIGTHYTPDGKPFGGLLPMIFHFEPILQQES